MTRIAINSARKMIAWWNVASASVLFGLVVDATLNTSGWARICWLLAGPTAFAGSCLASLLLLKFKNEH